MRLEYAKKKTLMKKITHHKNLIKIKIAIRENIMAVKRVVSGVEWREVMDKIYVIFSLFSTLFSFLLIHHERQPLLSINYESRSK